MCAQEAEDDYYPCVIVGNTVQQELLEIDTEISALTCLDQAYSFVEGKDFAMGIITYPGLTSKELFKIMTEDDDMPWVKYLKENAKAYPYQNEPMTKSAFY